MVRWPKLYREGLHSCLEEVSERLSDSLIYLECSSSVIQYMPLIYTLVQKPMATNADQPATGAAAWPSMPTLSKLKHNRQQSQQGSPHSPHSIQKHSPNGMSSDSDKVDHSPVANQNDRNGRAGHIGINLDLLNSHDDLIYNHMHTSSQPTTPISAMGKHSCHLTPRPNKFI